jgi:hypothetical protein
MGLPDIPHFRAALHCPNKEAVMNRVVFIVITVIILLTGRFPSEAQQSQLYYIHDLQADPAKTGEVEAYIKDLSAQFKKYSFPFTMNAFSTMDYHYYAFIPIKSYADIDIAKKELGDIGQKMGADNFNKLIARRSAAIQHHSYFVIRYLPELSYIPSNPRNRPEEELFRHWLFCYPNLEKENEWRAVISKFRDVYKKTNYPFTENIYTVELGSDLPLYIFEERGTKWLDFYSSLNEAFKILGSEFTSLMPSFQETLRKIERRDGTYRPELSYIPEK